MLYSRRMVNRLTAINTSLITFYLMMSVAHEGLFMVFLTVHVMSWIAVEFSLLRLEKMEVKWKETEVRLNDDFKQIKNK